MSTVDVSDSSISVTTTLPAPETILVTEQAPEIIVVTENVIVGPKGDKGDPPTVSKYLQTNATIVGGVLTIDASAASTYFVLLDQDVTSIQFINWPAVGQSQRIAIYTQQDATGTRQFTGWPVQTLTPENNTLLVTALPSAIDCFVVDSFDSGNTIFATLVGTNYS